MYVWQHKVRFALFDRLAVMRVAMPLKRHIYREPVGANGRARIDVCLDERDHGRFVDSVDCLAIDVKLDKLMTAYLENALTLAEYQSAKNKLITEKQVLKDKLEAFGRNSTNRFEPVINFLKDCKEADILAKSTDTEKIRSFFQKVGSNPLVRDRALVFSPRAPFAFVPEIPKTANEYAGEAAGGVWGGMPPRPPLGIFPSPFSDDFSLSAKLCREPESNW